MIDPKNENIEKPISEEEKLENDLLEMTDVFGSFGSSISSIDDLEAQRRTGLRVIKTARTLDEINEGVREGYTPLIQQIFPSSIIKVNIRLKKDLTTGQYKVERNGWGRRISPKNKDLTTEQHKISHKIRRKIRGGKNRKHIDNTNEKVYEYYPYKFPSPFAAYLVPSDIEVGERVVLEDLIEDYQGRRYQSDVYRLSNAEAKWDGEEFVCIYSASIFDCVMG